MDIWKWGRKEILTYMSYMRVMRRIQEVGKLVSINEFTDNINILHLN